MSMLTVEVVYALPDQLFRYTFQVEEGTTLLGAVKHSPLLNDCPDLDLNHISMGIFGKKVLRPTEHCIEGGDRIELYRPITADPKALRKQRAARKKKP